MPDQMQPAPQRDPELEALLARAQDLNEKAKQAIADSVRICDELADVDKQMDAYQRNKNPPPEKPE